MSLTEAIILAGGAGTRLQGVVKNVPKPMADIKGRPFLCYVMDYLLEHDINRILFSVGYKHEIIRDYFGSRYKNLEIEYVVENEPLGTGGAIKKAMEFVREDDFLILNGDTFFNVDLKKLFLFHLSNVPTLTLSLKPMNNFDRYGTVIIEGNMVKGFEEKSFRDFGYINGGVYAVNKGICSYLKQYNDNFRFSIEVDFLQKNVNLLKISAFISDGYFIDIGVPEDYEKAQKELDNIFKGGVK